MATNLTFGSLTICTASTGFYRVEKYLPGNAVVRDITFPNVTGLRGRVVGVRNTRESATVLIATGITADTSAANLRTLIANCKSEMCDANDLTETLTYAQPSNTGAAQTEATMRFMSFDLIPPFVQPTYQTHSTKWLLSWRATFLKYEN